MGTGIQNRPQAPAFQVEGVIAHQNGFKNPGAPSASVTSRHQARIGAQTGPNEHRATVQGNNYVKRPVAGAQAIPNQGATPTTRTAFVQHGRVAARGIVGHNTASQKGSGSNNLPKPVAGTADIFNVGGTGGRSANLVRVPHAANAPPAAKSAKIAQLHARGGHSMATDPTHAALTAPQAVPVHIGFNHVGYRK